MARHRMTSRAVGTVLATIALALCLTGAAGADPGPVVTDLDHGVTAAQLAQSLVGPGVAISNVTYTGSNRSAGSFSGGAAGPGFDSGIVLSSGKVQTVTGDPACSRGVEGPNTCHEVPGGPAGGAPANNSTALGTAGDADLTTLSGFPTFDATVLQFDFTPQYPTIQFRYVFSSEEYSDYSNTQYNDVFAFFVNGVNCALVPGTSQPVSVNTINNGNDSSGGDVTPHNPAYFRDNVRPAPAFDTQMDGLTTVLTCNATVNPGVANHMKLAIADASDSILDSAVFIEAGSLISGTQITTSLSGGGLTGAALVVPSGTAVTDNATLAGANASAATGTVHYQAFADAACTTVFADAGTKTVAGGMVPSSDPVTFTAAGTYYWTASYSGDAGNNPSASACGAETVIVKVGPPAHLTLEPPTASNPAGTSHTVTATVTDAANAPVAGVTVRFAVTGAHPTTGSAVTDASGKATFTYSATTPGTDTITAYADTNGNGTQDTTEPSGTATKTWVAAAPATITLTPTAKTNTVGTQHCVIATVSDAFGNPVPNSPVQFTVTGSVTTSGTKTTAADGTATFCYTGPALPGADAITATAQGGTNPTAAATKTWVVPTTTCGQAQGEGWIKTALGKGLFKFEVQSAAGGPAKGSVKYADTGAKLVLVSKTIDAVVIVDSSKVDIFGRGSVNGGPLQPFRITATHAKTGNTFSITWAGYTAAGPAKGDIEIQPCKGGHDDKGGDDSNDNNNDNGHNGGSDKSPS